MSDPLKSESVAAKKQHVGINEDDKPQEDLPATKPPSNEFLSKQGSFDIK